MAKHIRNITIYRRNGAHHSVADTETQSFASQVLTDYQNHRCISFPDSQGLVYIPYHAIAAILEMSSGNGGGNGGGGANPNAS